MGDNIAPRTLDDLFAMLVMGDETSHALYQEITANFALVHDAMRDRFDDAALVDLCEETKVLLKYLSDESCEVDAQSAEVVRQAMTAMQLLLIENANPEDVDFPNFSTRADSEKSAPQVNDESDANDQQEHVASDSQQESATAIELSAFLADAEMAVDFISESVEHIEQVDVQLLLLENNTADSEGLNAVFRAFHTIKGLSGFFGLGFIQDFAHVAETLLDNAREGKINLEGQFLDLTFDANECLKKAIGGLQNALENGTPVFPDPMMQDTGRRLSIALQNISEGKVDSSTPEEEKEKTEKHEVKEVDSSTPVGPVCVEQIPTDSVAQGTSGFDLPDVDSKVAVEKQEEVGTPPASSPPAPEPPQRGGSTPDAAVAPTKTIVRETIRVDATRLDLLMDSVGELVIAESILAETEELKSIQSLQMEALLGHMDKITRELQEMAMSLRMMPIKPTFQKMARLARDVAKKLNRQVEFITKGDETELDKSVVDSLGDPLVHMVRNAIDHGLEKSVEERRAAGKSDKGQVELRAFHQGGNIVIEIEDDGRGMNRDIILAKAIKNGILAEGDGETMSDNDVFGLIFAPGFSTAEKLTDVSGRGVGLDVVLRGIEALRGTVEVSSVLGQGSVFTLRLPLTLAIIEGMVVRVGGQKYIVPTLSIVRMQKLDKADVSTVLESGHLLRVGGNLVPLYRLADVFEIQDVPSKDDVQSVVIVEGNKKQYAFIVDELIGQQQIVIKGLGQAMGGTRGLSGGAIMADGRVGLILDIIGLVRLAEACTVTTSL